MIERVCNVCGNHVLVSDGETDVYCPCETPAKYMKSAEELNRKL